MKTTIFRLVLLFGLAIQSSQLLATTPLSASMNVTSSAALGSQFDTDDDADSWGVVLSPLSVSASSEVLTAGNQPGVKSGGTAAANWVDANHGNVSFSDVGWTFYTAGPNGASVGSSNSRNWRYQFVAEGDGYFRVRFDIVSQGSDTFGLNGFTVGLIGGPESFQGDNYLDSLDPAGSYSLEAQLTVGSVYTAFLALQSNVSGGGARTAYMNANFDWSISAVPEPSTVAMLTISIAYVCGISRRRT
jgi:hypothetical protein